MVLLQGICGQSGAKGHRGAVYVNSFNLLFANGIYGERERVIYTFGGSQN